MVHIQDLCFGYKKKETLFSNLKLSISPGNIYGLLGKNGAGKTTLLKIIAGLLFPQSGSCTVMGINPRERSPRFLEKIYMIPEEFTLPTISIKQYAELYAPFYPAFSREQFGSYLAEFSLEEGKSLASMSYGQKKKFLLAFGLATNAELFLLDEPSNGLDIPSKSQFRKLIASAVTDARSFIISTHQVRDMENLIDPIIILDEGKIIFQQHVYDVSEKLAVHFHKDEPEPGSAIYVEKVVGGYTAVSKNTSGDNDSHVDLEILFNAVISNKETIHALFSKERTI